MRASPRTSSGIVGSSIHRSLIPASLDRADAANGVADVPAHVGIGHDVDVGADGIDHGSHELDVLGDPSLALERAVRKPLLDGREALLDPRRGLASERVEVLGGIEPARVGAERRAHLPAEQAVDRHSELLPEQVPQRDVDRADRVKHDSAPADVQGRAVHRLPDVRDLGGRPADDERLELAQDLDRGRIPESRRADADEPVGVLQFDDDEPRTGRLQAGRRRAAWVDEALQRGERGADRSSPALRRRIWAGRDGRDSNAARPTRSLRGGCAGERGGLAEPAVATAGDSISVKHRRQVDRREQSAMIIRGFGLTSQPCRGRTSFKWRTKVDATRTQGLTRWSDKERMAP